MDCKIKTKNMSNKINVAILFGGRSAEHEVSIQSAKNIFNAIDKEKYNTTLIKINKKGEWFLCENERCFLEEDENFEKIRISITPGCNGIALLETGEKVKIDVVFPILHGPFGEDGTAQGLLKLANIPFVGAGVLGSAIGMDKEVMKKLLKEALIPIGKYLIFSEKDSVLQYEEVVKELGQPLFIKPANMGSSIGVSKVNNKNEYEKAINLAFDYDLKIIVEEFIKGREIECSVLGNNKPKASLPGEIVPVFSFYSYEAKYLDDDGAKLEVPAKIDSETIKKIQELAIKTFQTLSCEGLGRVDFFLKEGGEVIVNEINTLPGFTKISMYPKLWEESGIAYTDLITNLIELAVERFKKEEQLKTNYID
jgi:D-alanine-D-alanine ligase